MIRPTIVHKDIERNGRIIRTYEIIKRDYSKPFTPQTGLETRIGDISFMVAHHLDMKKNPAYLSKLQSGNPFDLQVMANNAAASFENAKKVVKSKSKNS